MRANTTGVFLALYTVLKTNFCNNNLILLSTFLLLVCATDSSLFKASSTWTSITANASQTIIWSLVLRVMRTASKRAGRSSHTKLYAASWKVFSLLLSSDIIGSLSWLACPRYDPCADYLVMCTGLDGGGAQDTALQGRRNSIVVIRRHVVFWLEMAVRGVSLRRIVTEKRGSIESFLLIGRL